MLQNFCGSLCPISPIQTLHCVTLSKLDNMLSKTLIFGKLKKYFLNGRIVQHQWDTVWWIASVSHCFSDVFKAMPDNWMAKLTTVSKIQLWSEVSQKLSELWRIHHLTTSHKIAFAFTSPSLSCFFQFWGSTSTIRWKSSLWSCFRVKSTSLMKGECRRKLKRRSLQRIQWEFFIYSFHRRKLRTGN